MESWPSSPRFSDHRFADLLSFNLVSQSIQGSNDGLTQPAEGQFLNAVAEALFQVWPAVVGGRGIKQLLPLCLQLRHGLCLEFGQARKHLRVVIVLH